MYQNVPFGQAYAIMVRIVFTQRYSFNIRVRLSSGAISIIFCLDLHLLSHFAYARSDGSGETTQQCNLV